MSEAAPARPWKVAMRARSPHEPHRVATPLELFFDLVFVVAIAQAAEGLHHDIAEAHVAHALLSYVMVFFGIWWAWMNFTWFASAYDCDDTPYRLSVFVQITGALIFAAGVKQMFADGAINGATLGGYVVMRLAGVTQWLRAGASDPERRQTTRRYAIGVSVCQLAWIGLYFVPSWSVAAFVIFGLAELAVPVWAERASPTTWHPHHIAERYGLFTIIVLGESVLAATLAVQSALESGERLIALAPVIVGGLLIVYALWWLYFYRPVHDLLDSHQLMKAVTWGYGHFVVFGSAAAVGAGLAVMVDSVTAHATIGPVGARAAVAIPVALYLLSLWWLHYRPGTTPQHAFGGFVAISLILVTPLTSFAVPLIGVILAALLISKLMQRVPITPPAEAHIAS